MDKGRALAKRHLVGMRGGHFDIIPEDIIVSDLQRWHAGCLTVFCLQSGNELPAFITQRDQLIQFGRISLSDKSTIASQQGQIRRQRTVQPLDKCRVFAELFGGFDNRRRRF